MTSARSVLDLALDRAATLGPGRLVCLDGPAGSGKTTLAAALVGLAPDARVVHMDDLYAGWDGLPAVSGQLDALLGPLASGRPGSYRRWDWHARAFAETVTVAPTDLLVLEGVGSWSPAQAAAVTVLAWVTAPDDQRTARVLARDGDHTAPYWESWRASEAHHFSVHRTRSHADLVITTSRPEVSS